MKIDVVIVPRLLDSYTAKDNVIVVIDVLRATTTFVTALFSGAHSILPLRTSEEVFKVSEQYSRDKILKCGERGGIRIQGFDKGNSPLEYMDNKIKGKKLLFTTTNGSQVFRLVENSRYIMTAGFVNISAVVEKLIDLNTDCLLVCSGIEGRFSLEDTVCAGFIVRKLEDRFGTKSITIGDDAIASVVLCDYFTDDLIGMLKQSENGKNLTRIGLEDDLAFCATVDRFDFAPVLKNGWLTSV